MIVVDHEAQIDIVDSLFSFCAAAVVVNLFDLIVIGWLEIVCLRVSWIKMSSILPIGDVKCM